MGLGPEKLVEVVTLLVFAVGSRGEDGRGKNEDVAEVATMAEEELSVQRHYKKKNTTKQNTQKQQSESKLTIS